MITTVKNIQINKRIPRIPRILNLNVLNWWFNQKKKLPLLSQIAKRLLCIQATSTPSERLFSAAGFTVWYRHNALSPLKIDKMMVLHHYEKNLKKMNQKYIESQKN